MTESVVASIFSKLDFTNPKTFYCEIKAVAEILFEWVSQFPVPLLATVNLPPSLEAVDTDDNVTRLDYTQTDIESPTRSTLRHS